MATKTKSTIKGKAEPKKEPPQFSYEFLDMLADTAFHTLNEHLKKTKAPQDVTRLVDIAYCLVLEQMDILQGGRQNNDSISIYVAEAVKRISALGGEWFTPTGSVTPLKDLLAMKAKRKGKS